jgi:hypothetical protein
MSAPLDDDQAVLAEHEELVAAPFAVVWRLLEEKVYHPERSVPGVENVRILNDGGSVAGVERIMFHKGRGHDIHEIIKWESDGAKGHVSFAMLEDPLLEGVVMNYAEAAGEAATRVRYKIDWKFKSSVPLDARKPPFPDRGAGAIRGAVLAMKKQSEEAAA